MDKFLVDALAPRAKRKAPMGQGDKTSRTLGSTSTAMKRRQLRRGSETDKTPATPATTAAKDKPVLEQVAQNNAKRKATAPDATVPADLPSSALPSFRDAMTGGGTPAGPTRTRMLYDKAQVLVEEGRLEDGLKAFTRALIACACQGPTRRQFKQAGVPLEVIDPIGHCSCRDFVAAAQTRRNRPALPGRTTQNTAASAFPISELDLAAVHRLATDGASCMCGSGRVRCTLPDHLDTLDRLAVLAMKLGQVDLAYQVSQWHVDLAPHEAQGYLHLAKAVLSKQASARFEALCIYNHGRHNVCRYGDPASPFLSILTRCCRQYSRGDFLHDFPVEIAEAILAQLSLPDLLACLRVSKTWAATLRRLRLLLDLVALPGAKFTAKKPQRHPPLRGLALLLRRLPGLQARQLRIVFPEDPRDRFMPFLEGAMQHFQARVESIELSTWWYGPNALGPRLVVPRSMATVSRCRKLVLSGLEKGFDADIRGIVQWASPSLEHLELSGLHKATIDFPLPRLRIFKAARGVWTNKIGLREPSLFVSICAAAPQLEQLYLEAITFDDDPWGPADAAPPSAEDFAAMDSMLQCLHTFYIDSVLTPTEKPYYFPRLPLSMRCIDILHNTGEAADMILLESGRRPFLPDVPHRDRRFTKLEAFRCLAHMTDPQRIWALIQPSLNGPHGRLAHLELCADRLGRDFVRGDAPYRFLYPERLRTVGLYNFDWNSGPTASLTGGIVRDGAFLDWVEQFQWADSIAVYPSWSTAPSTCGTAQDIMDGELLIALVGLFAKHAKERDSESWSQLRLRTVYTGIMQGAMHGHMTRWQDKTFGQQLVQFPKGHSRCRAPVFPWPDRVEAGGEGEAVETEGE